MALVYIATDIEIDVITGILESPQNFFCENYYSGNVQFFTSSCGQGLSETSTTSIPRVINWNITFTRTGAFLNILVSSYPAVVKVEFYDARTLNLLKSAYFHLEDRSDLTTFFPLTQGEYIVKVFTVNQHNPHSP
jgi:hypothetical protein